MLPEKLQSRKKELIAAYKRLIEEAYNLSQTDSALSDAKEFKALKLLDELNRLNFLDTDPVITAN